MKANDLTVYDEDLMTRIAGGDSTALQLLFEKYYTPLCKFTSVYLKDTDRTEELVSDLFMKIWDKRTTLIIQSVKHYLFTSARNMALNSNQKAGLQTMPIEGFDAVLDIEDVHLNPHDLLSSKESFSEIIKLIDQLPERQREVLLMSRVQYLDKENISKVLNISVRTVETLLYQAVKRFRDLITAKNLRSRI
ncbi:RNA polymerase sigma factor [Pedobacter sp. AW1-32]|uniref:RNA polymerase sigma factor n=1 Tax=Pedobacter sp. AW1-32 TaxID=3383026 RepID=UPI003FEF57B9